MSQKLPEARLVPKDGADRITILRGHVGDGARKAGRIAVLATKAIAMVGLCGVGLIAIGAGARTRSSFDSSEIDRRMESMRRMNETLRQMPKLDFKDYYKDLRRFQLDSTTTPGLVHDTGASPSQALSTSSR